MSKFDLSNVNNKVRNYKLTEDFIKIAEQRLKKNKEQRDRLVEQCDHEIILKVGCEDIQLICLVCNSCFVKDSKNYSYTDKNIIDVSFLDNINLDVLLQEARKFLIEIYEEYGNKLSIDEIKEFLLNYLIEFNKYLEGQNLEGMGDDFEKDTYEIMRNYQRKVREKRTNKSS